MINTLTQEQLKELVSITAEKLRIKFPAIIEKDYYVTQVIKSLSGIENEHFRLVFAGGTCLAKAYKIVKRMSEDIDFKIQLKNENEFSSNNQLIKALKNFRQLIQSSISLPNLKLDEFRVRNDGKYVFAELTYPALFDVNDVLRPHLLLEFTHSNIRLGLENLSINTIIEENNNIPTPSPPTSINCISINETAIEKWIGLTRKIIAIERNHIQDDTTLIRHIYDLNAIKNAGKIESDFLTLAKTIMNEDAEQFKNQHPEYFANPNNEIHASLATLKNNAKWKERYQKFINTMVYDSKTAPMYENAILLLEELSNEVLKFL